MPHHINGLDETMIGICFADLLNCAAAVLEIEEQFDERRFETG
jgi:hypothetical protein